MQVIKPGTELGHFKIISRLGAGGMGAVFKALDSTLEREVALKVLDSRLCENEEGVKRFQREARTIAQLRHPNLMHIYAVGEHEGVQYFAMEYIKGTPLNAMLIKHGGKLKLSAALRVTIEIMAGLQKVHSQGIIHRDLKPANVMIDGDDHRAILVDFGLSKEMENEGLTSDGSILGTPDYMSPEQIEGKDLGPYTDIYSLGVMLYEMLSGSRPFSRKTTMQTLRAQCEFVPDQLDGKIEGVTRGLSDILRKMMAKKPQERYQSIDEIALALSAICRHPQLNRLIGKDHSKEKTVVDKAPARAAQSHASTRKPRKTVETSPSATIPVAPHSVSGKYISNAKARGSRSSMKYIVGGIIGVLLFAGIFLYRRSSTDKETTAENTPKPAAETPPPAHTPEATAMVSETSQTEDPTAKPDNLPVVNFHPKGQTAPREGLNSPSVILLLKNNKQVRGYLTSISEESIKVLLNPEGNAEYPRRDIQAIISLESGKVNEIMHTGEGGNQLRKNFPRRNPLRTSPSF